MNNSSFIHKKEEYLDRVTKGNTDIRLLAKHSSLEIMKQKIADGSSFYLDSSEDWQGFEFIYLIKGKMEYTDSEPPIELEPGDYLAREGVPEESWFKTKSDVTVLYTSTQPAFYLLRDEIEDYLKLAERIESVEHMDGHSKRLVRMSSEIGKRLGLSPERLSDLRYASFFHDIGKARVPDRMLEKEGNLTDEEWGIMEKHTIWGKEMLEGADYLDRAGEIVKQSHERPDGEGYPEGLSGEEILLEARIVAVVDAWDAMTSERPYQEGLGEEVAIQELKDNAGSQFDTEVVNTFINLLEEKEDIGSPTTGNRGSYKEETIQLRQRERLLDLSKEVLASRSTEKIAEKTLEAVVETTSFQRALISIFDHPVDLEDPSTVRVEFYSSMGLSEEEKKKLEEADQLGVEVDLEKFAPKYELGESYYVPHEERRKNFGGMTEIKSQLQEEATLDWHPDDSLYIPLYAREEKLIGQISVDDPEDGLVPSPESLRPIESFASLASLGIEKTSRNEELERREDRLVGLLEMAQELRERESSEEICEIAADWSTKLLEVDKCLVIRKEGNTFIPTCSYPLELVSEFKKQELDTSEADRTRITLKDLYEVEAESTLTVPLDDHGYLELMSDRKGALNEADKEFARLFADRVGEEISRAELEDQLREKATKDPLVDAYNRRYFNESLKKEVKKARRYDKSLAFLMLDINRFKEINDRYSHRKGDRVLKEVAKLLKKNIRGADTLVRYGGDEFLIMMPETEDEVEKAESRLQKALDRWNDRNALIDFSLTLAMGVSCWNPDQDRDVEEALKEADEKMYEDKREND